MTSDFSAVDPEIGPALAATYARLFMWQLDVRRDLKRGDQMQILYRADATGKPEVVAGRYHSGHRGKTFRAYRWQTPGDPFPSYWDEAGMEVSLRLRNGPLRTYSQITSLLKDRPTHAGLDFKTPTGTRIVSPRSGVVTRIDWNTVPNGRCLEIRFDDGVLARFLHLSKVSVRRGERVSAGQFVALSGNSGRSTAPHLHYELVRLGRVLDPLAYHRTYHRHTDAEAPAPFAAVRVELDSLLDLSGEVAPDRVLPP